MPDDGLYHHFSSLKIDDPKAIAAGKVVPSEWNHQHVVVGAPGAVLFNLGGVVGASDKLTFDPVTSEVVLGSTGSVASIQAVGAGNAILWLRGSGDRGGVAMGRERPYSPFPWSPANVLSITEYGALATPANGINIYAIPFDGEDNASLNGVSVSLAYPDGGQIHGGKELRGFYCQAFVSPPAGVLDSGVNGAFLNVGLAGPGTLYETNGVWIGVSVADAGVIENARGVHITSGYLAGGGTGSFTNLYGLKIEDQVGGVNSWAIKTGLGKVEFGDTVDAPAYLLNGEPFAATPGGTPGQVQFNLDGAFAGSLLQYDPVTTTLMMVTAPTITGQALGVYPTFLPSTANRAFVSINTNMVVDGANVQNIDTITAVGGVADNYGGGYIDLLQAGEFIAWQDGSGAIGRMFGLRAIAQSWTGALITNCAGIQVRQSGNRGSGTITNHHGIWIEPALNTGTMVNNYGLKIDDQTLATNNWAIKTGLGKVELGGPLTFGVGGATFNHDGTNPFWIIKPNIDSPDAAMKFRAPYNDPAGSKFISFFGGPGGAVELGYIGAVTGNNELRISATYFQTNSIQLAYNTGGFYAHGGGIFFPSTSQLAWSANVSSSGYDVAFNRSGVGALEINSSIIGQFRDLKLRYLSVIGTASGSAPSLRFGAGADGYDAGLWYDGAGGYGYMLQGTMRQWHWYNGMSQGQASVYGWAGGSNDGRNAMDVALGRNTAGVVEVNSGAAGVFRDLKLRALFAQGQSLVGAQIDAVLDLSTTWNTTGVVKGLIYGRVVNTAFGLDSAYIDLGDSVSSAFRVSRVDASGNTRLRLRNTPTGTQSIYLESRNPENGGPAIVGSGNLSLIAADGAVFVHQFTGYSNAFGDLYLRSLSASQQNLTGSAVGSVLDLAATWNTSGSPSAIKLNVTHTLAGAAAKLIDLQVSGVSNFSYEPRGVGSGLGVFRIAGYEIRSGGSEGRLRFNPQDIDGRYPVSFGYMGDVVVALGGGYFFGQFANASHGAHADAGLVRNAAGVIEINNGTAGQFRDLIVRSLRATGMPTAVAGLPAGTLWNNAGVVNVAP